MVGPRPLVAKAGLLSVTSDSRCMLLPCGHLCRLPAVGKVNGQHVDVFKPLGDESAVAVETTSVR